MDVKMKCDWVRLLLHAGTGHTARTDGRAVMMDGEAAGWTPTAI